MAESNVQRSLGRIEGTQTQILGELKQMRESLVAHTSDDEKNFNGARVSREAIHTKLEAMKADQDKAKGAGWVIIGLLGSMATFIGGAVLAVFNGWIKIH